MNKLQRSPLRRVCEDPRESLSTQEDKDGKNKRTFTKVNNDKGPHTGPETAATKAREKV